MKKHPSWRIAYGVTLISGVLCSDAPQENLFWLSIASLSFAFLGLRWLLTGARIPRNTSSVGLFLFFAAVAISLPVAMSNAITFRDWALRGAGPLVFLLVYLFLPIRTEDDADFVISALLLACALWAAKIALELASGNVLSVRWTSITRDFLLPFNLVALSFLWLDGKRLNKILRLGGILLFVVLTFGGGYRAQILLLALFLMALVLKPLARLRLNAGALALVATFAVTAGLTLTTEVGQEMSERFTGIASEQNSGRAMEISYAFDRFKNSPIIGNGLAYPIPVSLTFFGREDYLRGVAETRSNYTHVTYMHNSVMYLLMTLGALGFLGYATFIGGALFGRQQNSFITGGTRQAAWWALALILAFTLIAATMTLFQFNMLVGSLVALLVRRHGSATAAPIAGMAVDDR